MSSETVVAETKTEKVLEVQTQGSFLEHLDDSEREFIAKGIHNFAYRKEECYDEQATQDLRRELKAALKAIGSDAMIPDNVIDDRIDSAVLPLGQKKGYWLKRLISKTGGETQRLLRGLEKVNMFLRNYGQARRKPPVPPKKITVPIEKFQELEEKASTLDIKSAMTQEILTEPPILEIAPVTMETKVEEPKQVINNKIDIKSAQKPEAKREYDADSDTDREEYSGRHREKRHKSRPKKSKRVRFYEPSDSESSEESDDSEDDFQYYYKRFKKPSRVYSYRKPSKSHRPFSTPIPAKQRDFPPELFDTNVQIRPLQQQQTVEVQKPVPVHQPFQQPFQQQFVPVTNRPNNEYINHFLGNSRR